jgi:hypothetical protein
MALTSVHHLSGAIVYKTPWRAHVLFMSIPIIITVILTRFIQKTGNSAYKFLLWLYWVIILCTSVLLIGIFEGLYNHVLKNILFFSGFPEATLYKIYPPGAYEMPNDFFFEATEMMQGTIAVFLIVYFIKFTRQILKGEPQVHNA